MISDTILKKESQELESDYLQKFLQGQNLVDSSCSFVHLNSRTITDRSIRESFAEDLNEQVIQRIMFSNMRLLEEINKSQVDIVSIQKLEERVQELENECNKYKLQLQKLQERTEKIELQFSLLQKDNYILQLKLDQKEKEKENYVSNYKLMVPCLDPKYKFYSSASRLVGNQLLQKTENSFQQLNKKNPFIFTTRPQSPSQLARQSTPSKIDTKPSIMVNSNSTTHSQKDQSMNHKMIVEQLMRKLSRHQDQKFKK